MRRIVNYLKPFGISLPIYVTRKNADDFIMTYSMSVWMSLLFIMVVWLNVVSWGIFGMVELWRIW